MERKKATQESIQEYNLGLILKLIKENKNISRVMLSIKTKLSKSTISGLVDILISKKLITEGDKINSSRGKKPTTLHFNGTYCYLMAINIGINFFTVVITDLYGEILYRIKKKNSPKKNKNGILDNLFNIIEEAIDNSKISMERIYLFSIGTHGIVNPETKKIMLAPYLPKLQETNLVDIIKEKYKKEVIIENSVRLGALGEHWKNYSNIDNIVYISIHYGTAAGIIIDGKLAIGTNGTMGEIAYLPILKKYNPKKIKENKFGLGLFESQIDIVGITNTIKDKLKTLEKSTGPEINKNIDKIDFDYICKRYNSAGDNAIKKTIDNDIIKILAMGIASVIAVIDAKIIIINGGIIELGSDFFDKFKKEIYDITPFKPDIVISKLKRDAPIIGEIKFGLNYIDDLLYNRIFSLL
jgi:predicted NBD/HSP70 family sugar kinase